MCICIWMVCLWVLDFILFGLVYWARLAFIFQAEDGIRDAHYRLKFRRVLFRSVGRAVRDPAAVDGDAARLRADGRHGHRPEGGNAAGARVRMRYRRRLRHLQLHRGRGRTAQGLVRSEEHTSELQSLMRISYAVFCLKKKKKTTHIAIKYAT